MIYINHSFHNGFFHRVFDGSTAPRMRAQYPHLSHGYDHGVPRELPWGHYTVFGSSPGLPGKPTKAPLVTFYKIRANYINIRFPDTVRQSPHHADRYLHIQSLHSDAYKYHFFTRTVRMWNLIPVQALTTDSVNTFRTLTSHWITPLSWSKINNTWTPTMSG